VALHANLNYSISSLAGWGLAGFEMCKIFGFNYNGSSEAVGEVDAY